MYRMFRTAVLTGIVCAGMAAGPVLFAQENPPAQDQTSAPMHPGRHHGPMSPDKELAHLTKALHLSSDQQSQLKPILEDRQQQLMQVHQDTSASREDRMSKMKSIDSDSNAKVEAVLNDQQKTKYEQMIERRKQRMHEMREQGGHPPNNQGGEAQPQ